MALSDELRPEGLAQVTGRSLWMPKHLVLSAWTEHAPFAFWLVEAHRPRTIVELGTHNGLSYFTFCQAVDELGLGTRCFAVDTWEGDEHAGFYSDEVFALVDHVNAARYAAFSQLMRSTFDAAVDRFEDGSIDLLHIDGRHFYEDVEHDFATWLPKLSSRGVALLHDTNVRKRGFGVHRLWSEVREDYHGSVEFLHGHGLGVLQVGANVDPELAAWFERNRDSGALTALRTSYERLGRGVLDHFEVAESSRRIQELTEKLSLANAAVDRRNESVRVLEAEAERLRAVVDRRDESLRRLEASRDRTRAALEQAEAKVRQSGDEVRRHREEAEAAQQLLADRIDQVADLRHQLHRLRSRRAIRLALAATNPLRPLFRFVRRVRRRLSTEGARASSTKRGAGDRVQGGGPERLRPSGVGDPLRRRPERVAPSSGSATEADAMVVDTSRDGSELFASLQRVGMPTILVPIFNAPRELSRCLESIERNTTVDAFLLLINDASTDPRVQEVLGPWRARARVRVLDHDVNRGFTATVNHGLDETDGDVIVLNSDTEVPPSWIQNLRRAAYANASIGTVTPLSDNSGAFAVPHVGVRNPIPVHLGTDGVARLLSRGSLHALPDTPTGNGFCWYVKRPVIDSIGKLDEGAFPRGYGEENDFCMRASKAGWRHVVDDATYVAHTREASFGSEKRELVTAGRRVIDERYPEYTDRVRSFVHGPEMVAVREQVRQILSSPTDRAKPRILYVAQMGRGGTPATTRDLAGAVEGWEVLLLESDGRKVRLLRLDRDQEEVLERFCLSRPVVFADRQHEEYDAALTGVIRRYGVELVHVRHLIKQPLSAARIASALGLPVVFSFHDYFFSCPSVNLLDDSDRFCGGICTPGMGTCRIPTPWIGDSAPELKHAWVHTWREIVRDAIEDVDAFVTASEAARQVMIASLPELGERRFEVIEHGREITQHSLAESPSSSGPVRVLVAGNLDLQKGEGLLRQIRALDADERLEFHFVGRISKEARAIGVDHGPYDRDGLAAIVRDIRPSFVAVLSLSGETYSHTLTEAWSLGLPVVACDRGALGERVRRHGGGLLVDPCDAQEAYRSMCRLIDEPRLYARLVREAERYVPRTVGAMARDYEELYLDVTQTRRAFTAEPTRPRIGLLVPGCADVGKWTGSTHVRFGRRYDHPSVRAHASVRFLDSPSELGKTDLDVLMVLRNGLMGEHLSQLLEHSEFFESKLVLDLDDALTEREMFPVGSIWRDSAEDIARLAVEADLVTVATEPLRQLVRERYNEHAVVVPNLLDDRLWFAPVEGEPAEQARPTRILYFGTKTHAKDLELLRGVLPAVSELVGREVRLEVAGVAEQSDSPSWYDRLEIPDHCKPYPDFVRWLRRHRSRWDVGVAPLQSGGFNDFKSDLKFLELTALGLPVVASDVAAYRSTIRHGLTGLLVSEDSSAWAAALAEVLVDTTNAVSLVEKAREYVESERTLIARSSMDLGVALDALRDGGAHRA